jgi:hypothetical protein
MRQSTRFLGIGLVLSLAAIATAATAGQQFHYPVTIYSGGAYGAVSYVRHSSDTVSFIGCSTEAAPGKAPSATCYAMDATGKYVNCWTSDANLVAMAGRINDTSLVSFSFTSTSGACAEISVDNGSGNAP